MSAQGTPVASEQASRIGQTAMIDVEQLRIPVRVLEAKTAWGSTRFLVEPVHGSGSQWVTEGRLRFPAAVPAVSLGDGVEDAEIVG